MLPTGSIRFLCLFFSYVAFVGISTYGYLFSMLIVATLGSNWS